MPTLYAAQEALRESLTATVRTAWNPKAISYNVPETNEGNAGENTGGKGSNLPQAFLVMREATPNEEVGGLCSEPVDVVVECSLRFCPPREGQGSRDLPRCAQALRDGLGVNRSLASVYGHSCLWLGESYIDPDLGEQSAPAYATVRVRLRFTLEVDL